MMATAASQLSDLETAKLCHGPECAANVEALLASLGDAQFEDAETLIRFHDSLLFLRAFPQSERVAELAEGLLAHIEELVEKLRQKDADWELFDSEQFSGIAGTAIEDTFTYEVALWLAGRYPEQLQVAWNFEEQGRQMAVSLPRLLPLLADDSLVEADTPYLAWLSDAAGGRDRILPWLLRQINNEPLTMLQKTELYDALAINISWKLGDSGASRTRARWPTASLFLHREPLIRRNQVSLAHELNSPPLSLRKLERSEGEKVLDFTRAAITARYRELYGTTRGDAGEVFEADVGRGVQIFLWGLPPDRRLPLRAYHAGLTVKNGVPINYIEGISLFDWMEVGFNTFYAYRDGETAWIYSKVLHALHQLTGMTCFSVYPYQLGEHNEEAIKSGAFWFYRKLGFRPGRPELLKITKREEARMAREPGHRTTGRTLRKLAAGHVFYEFGEGPRGQWDSFSTRNIGLAVQRRVASEFNGDPDAMRQAATGRLSQLLAVDIREWSRLEQAAFADFALVLWLAPEVAQWTEAEKQTLVEVIRAKVSASEVQYLRMLQHHAGLREVFRKLGAEGKAVSSPNKEGC